jgi:hypothetical protein
MAFLRWHLALNVTLYTVKFGFGIAAIAVGLNGMAKPKADMPAGGSDLEVVWTRGLLG